MHFSINHKVQIPLPLFQLSTSHNYKAHFFCISLLQKDDRASLETSKKKMIYFVLEQSVYLLCDFPFCLHFYFLSCPSLLSHRASQISNSKLTFDPICCTAAYQLEMLFTSGHPCQCQSTVGLYSKTGVDLFLDLSISHVIFRVLFGAEPFVFQAAIQKFKDQDIQNYNLAFCFVWV